MKKIFITVLTLSVLATQAQQTANFTQIFVNPYLINPAFAGNSSDLQLYGHYRNQMLGLKGAPESMMFTLHKGLPNERMGLGIQAFNDRVNVLERSGANFTYSYLVPITAKHHLRFGLSLGFANNRIDMSKVVATDPTEISTLSNVGPVNSFNTDFGILYRMEKFQFGISAINLFNKTAFIDSKTLPYAQNALFNIMAKYEVKMTENIKMLPMVLARSSQGLGFQISANAIFQYKDLFWAGINWDSQASIGMCAGIKYENLTFGYHYGYPTSKLSSLSTGVHEVVLGFNFGSGKGKKELSNNGSQPVSAETTIQDNTTNTNKLSTDSYSNRSKMSGRPDTLYHIVVMQDGADAEAMRKIFLNDQTSYMSENPNDTPIDEEKLEELSKTEEKEGDKAFKRDFPAGKANVIIAAYAKMEDAKSYQKLLIRQTGLESKVIKSEKDHFYFVMTKEVNNYKEAHAEIKRIKKKSVKNLIFGNIWLH